MRPFEARFGSAPATVASICRVPQEDDAFFSFHVEHILPRQHGGLDEFGNLALACYHCNRHKGPNLAALDPETGRMPRLFNPRSDVWECNAP